MLYQRQNPHGGDFYIHPKALDFSANVNPLGTPDSVRQAAAASLAAIDRYPDPCCRELIRAIARFEGVDERAVLCGCGAAELIFSFCLAAKPQCALELAPTFSEYSTALAASGCPVQHWSLKRENGFQLTEDFCSCLATGEWDVLFLCNPNNPTGQLIPPPLLKRVADICRKKNIRLFLDECFLDLTDGWPYQSLKDRLSQQPGLLILKAFTKSYGMAGLRLGYCLCGDERLLSSMSRLTQPWNISSPAQAAGIAALSETDFLKQTRTLIRQQRLWLSEQLKGLGLEVCPSFANFLLLYSPLPLVKRLAEQKIAVRDCANYAGLGEGWLRIAVRMPLENQRLVAALQKILEGR